MSLIRRSVDTYKGWPKWARIAAPVTAALMGIGAVSSGEDSKTKEPVKGVVSDSSSTTTQAPTKATTVSTRCQPYDLTTAEDLITNSDTGKRKIPGQILGATAVKSKESFGARDLWFISLNVDGILVTLAHDTPKGEGPAGPGLYASVDDVAERATSLPQTDRLKASLKTDGARASRDCVAAASATSTTATTEPTTTTTAKPTTTTTAKPTTTTTAKPTTTTTRPTTSTAPPTTVTTGVYYANCDAARAAGVAPIYEGQAGYRPGLDRDKDGIACDK